MTAAEILRARRKVEEAARKAAKAARQLGTVAVQAPTGSESLTSTQTATLSVAVQTLPRVVVFFDLAQGTPDDIATTFGEAVAEITARPEIQERMLSIGFFGMSEKPAELAEMNKREFASYEAWVKRANFKID